MQVNNTRYHTKKSKIKEYHQYQRMHYIMLCLLLLCMKSGYILNVFFLYLVCCFEKINCYLVILVHHFLKILRELIVANHQF